MRLNKDSELKMLDKKSGARSASKCVQCDAMPRGRTHLTFASSAGSCRSREPSLDDSVKATLGRSAARRGDLLPVSEPVKGFGFIHVSDINVIPKDDRALRMRLGR